MKLTREMFYTSDHTERSNVLLIRHPPGVPSEKVAEQILRIQDDYDALMNIVTSLKQKEKQIEKL